MTPRARQLVEFIELAGGAGGIFACELRNLGVSGFTLAVVPADQTPAGGKVVGHCQGDQQIVYTRGADAADSGRASPVNAPSRGHVKMGAMGEGKPEQGKPDEPAPPASASSSGP